jgi:hypothetical protein
MDHALSPKRPISTLFLFPRLASFLIQSRKEMLFEP